MKNKCIARKVYGRIGAAPLPDGCVIAVPGQNIEVTAIFKSWIYEGPKSEVRIEPQGKRHHETASNQGIIAAFRG